MDSELQGEEEHGLAIPTVAGPRVYAMVGRRIR
jgi:hypothetical protein